LSVTRVPGRRRNASASQPTSGAAGVAEQGGALLLRAVVDPSPVVLRAERHQQAALRAHRRVERVDHAFGAAGDRADRAQRGMHHDRHAVPHAQAGEVGGDLGGRGASHGSVVIPGVGARGCSRGRAENARRPGWARASSYRSSDA
jgi:hypothetical protein